MPEHKSNQTVLRRVVGAVLILSVMVPLFVMCAFAVGLLQATGIWLGCIGATFVLFSGIRLLFQ